MKKYFLSFLFIVVLFVSCSDESVNQVNPYQTLLEEFNGSSGFNAVLINDSAIVATAKAGQGHGDYPGVDDWFAVEINFGMVVLGGLPGQSAFYSILDTYNKSRGNKEAYWKLLQVKPHPVFGYRPYVGCYELNQKINTAISKTLANPKYGEGGGWQLYIHNYDSSLTKFTEITLDTTIQINDFYRR